MERKVSDRWHGTFWMGGAICALIPFIIPIFFGGWRAPWVESFGNFGTNVVLATWWAMGGASLGGLIWLKLSGRTLRGSFKKWCAEHHHFHWFWFLLTIVIYGAHNYLVLDGFPFTDTEKLSAMLGRVLTGAVIVGLYWLACGVTGGLAPQRLKKFPWVVAAFLPVVLLADYICMLIWNNTVLNMVNQLDGDGTFDLATNLAGGGVAVPAFAVVLGFFALVWGVFKLCVWIGSRRWASSFRMQRWVTVIFVFGFWGGVWAEKGAGMMWKSHNARRWEHNSYDVHVTKGLEPPMGVAKFKVAFIPKSISSDKVNPTSGIRPDIFVIMVESLRQDAISEKHAPFLTEFRDHECQPLGRTFSSSNATSLAWYGLFHGVPPIFWCGDKARTNEEGGLPTPPWFALLQSAGYRTEIRTASDLAFQNLGDTSFGSDRSVYQALSHYSREGIHWEDYYDDIPKIEEKAFSAVLSSLGSAPTGGNFHFIALDSTHWGYRWPGTFTPPYRDFFDGNSPPAYPKENDLRMMKNRYHNSVAWVDYQIEGFANKLRAMGRYENSLIIVTGDHGEEFHENGGWFHSSSLLPPQTQVPILIKWPADVRTHPQTSASHLDLLPSLRGLFGLRPDSALPGRSLLKREQKERTQISFTCNTGVSKVCMAWYRDGWTATFRWENSWSHETPTEIHLDDIVGPEGERFTFETEEEWRKLLKKKFPDAPKRLFSQFELDLTE